jgi:hypothetical protein
MSNGLTLPFAGTFDSDKQVFAITQPAQGGTAIWAFSGGLKKDGSPGIGVAGTSYAGGTGVQGVSDSGSGVHGQSDRGTGIYGSSKDGRAIVGVSQSQDAINGTSSSQQHAGVSANNNAGGFGLWAKAKTAGYFYGDGGYAIEAISTSVDTDTLIATSSSPHHAAVSANNNAGGFGLWAKAKIAGYFDGDVQVTGDIRLLNADVAENFDIADATVGHPGSVMVLDDAGALQLSSRPYDKRVVGVVSGAGHLKPGLVLDNGESRTPRAQISLVGKVFCKVDASTAPIEIGDLLTTSATPGHAMKADDPLKAFGAVIGKALGSLRSGKGLIPVLVALQ